MPHNRFLISIVLVYSAGLAPGGHTPDEQSALEPENLAKALEVLNLAPSTIDAMKPKPKDSPLLKLQRERCRQRAIALATIKKDIQVGKWNPEDFPEVLKLPVAFSKNLADLMEKDEDKIRCYESRLEFLKEIEHFTDVRVMVGSDPSMNRDLTKAVRIDAEIDLLKLKKEIEKVKK